MTINGWIQIAIYSITICLLTKPLGIYLYRVFETDRPPLRRLLQPLERLAYRLCGVEPSHEQDWKEYALSVMLFSLFGMVVTYLILRLQGILPFNPQKFGAVEPWLAFNTAISFVSNTNWQAYSGETTMSYLSQMAGLAWHNFTSAATGIAVALAVARGFTRHRDSGSSGSATIGNFWVDLWRGTIYVLLPFCVVLALLLVSQGVIQNFSPYREIATLEGARQTIPMGPVASQEAIKMLGTNGGGFFNANSAHPYENPTPLSNFLEMLMIFCIPVALTYTYGRMAHKQRQGWALFAAMAFLFLCGVFVTYWAESHPNPVARGLAVAQTAGNMEGKEVRFGVANSSLFTVITTDASCGAVNSMHDSHTPLGGMVPLVNIELGEVIFGGVGAGLYGMLIFVLLTVFIAGLKVGRTPEYLGKKIEAREMQLAMLYILIFPFLILVFSGWSAVAPYGISSLNNGGPHGLTEILYAFSSAAGNNGSAFAGLNANTPWYNITLGLTMFFGRFFMLLPVLAIAGSMAPKKTVPAGPGTFPTDGLTFVILLVGVVLIVGALTFFPALALGPIVEHFLAANGKVF
ncbi:MAG: potassium-transporting ATPase subunit KdpA [Candidatus Sumerlaeota bacterium]|nr:potassium-transporting ATPase subunit KdpA [Candidatus Sumerlaeota bacterium]